MRRGRDHSPRVPSGSRKLRFRCSPSPFGGRGGGGVRATGQVSHRAGHVRVRTVTYEPAFRHRRVQKPSGLKITDPATKSQVARLLVGAICMLLFSQRCQTGWRGDNGAHRGPRFAFTIGKDQEHLLCCSIPRSGGEGRNIE